MAFRSLLVVSGAPFWRAPGKDGHQRTSGSPRHPEGRRLAEVIRDDAPLSAVDRLEVYANAYFFRILEVLRKDYPALAASLGEARFNNLITDYLAANPPTRFSLRYAGEELGSFLGGHPAARPPREEFPWAADLARLEWAIVDAFDTLFSADNEVMRVVGPAPMGGEFLEIVMDEKPLRQAMLNFSLTILLLSLAISGITAMLVYFALDRMLVRPMRRITANIMRFRDDPENPARVIGRVADLPAYAAGGGGEEEAS